MSSINGVNVDKRQLLTLIAGEGGAEAFYDPTTAPPGYDPVTDAPAGVAQWFLRVRWEDKDKLQSSYCFTVDDCPDIGKVENVSLFHGNLDNVSHGNLQATVFKEPGTPLTANEFYFERVGRWDQRDDKTGKWGTLCALPGHPLAYRSTEPGGDIPPVPRERRGQ